MSRILLTAIMVASLLLSLCGCRKQEETAPKEYENAIYHWKGHMFLPDEEIEFLNKHDIGRIYVRLFDVVSDYRFGAIPESNTYLELSELPAGTKITPTVFITLEALKEMRGREAEFADNIYQRIIARMKEVKIEYFDEVQIDCDWTGTTRDIFFKLCEAIGTLAHEDGRKLSATIRLHQLRQPAPPVDSGVLMVYNVGELQDADETNSILRTDIVKEYLDNAPEYPLTLDVAYPVFSWGAVFRGDRFDRLMRLTESIDSMPGMKHLHDNIYEVTNPTLSESLLPSSCHETLRYEFVTPETLMEVKKLVEKYLGGRPRRVILYHLDESTISRYTDDQISSIYE